MKNTYANVLANIRRELVTEIDATIDGIARAYHECRIDYTQAARFMREAGACEPEIREALK